MKLNKLIQTTALSTVIAATFGIASVQAADETFESTIRLIKPITITEVAGLRFPEQVAGTAQAVVVTPDDSGAAVFNATGEASKLVVASVVESSIVMSTDDGVGTAKQITVDNFELGGSVLPDGSGSFNGDGDLNNIRVGGTANIEADDIAGSYSGTATFRLVYA